MGLLDEMRAPPRARILGLLADGLNAAKEYANKPDATMPSGLLNPPLSMLSNLVGLPSLAKTVDRMSYGDPLTNASKANVPFLKPETADSLMLAPISPRAALSAAGMIGGVDNGMMRAATVWHGSPHTFDKFSAGKIGTGEGAQAYGHGLYLADSPEVAMGYRAKLNDPIIDSVKADLYEIAGDPQWSVKAFDAAGALIPKKGGYLSPGEISKYYGKQVADIVLGSKYGGHFKNLGIQEGAIYKVDLPDDKIARMLDWDKPLSQQAPGVLELLQSVDKRAKDSLYGSGGEYYRALMARHADNMPRHIGVDAAEVSAQTPASQQLRNLGIPGIRYLDGGSRANGAGTSNYVVFPGEENALTILERNGAKLR